MHDQEVNEIDEYVESYKHKRKLLVEKRKKYQRYRKMTQ